MPSILIYDPNYLNQIKRFQISAPDAEVQFNQGKPGVVILSDTTTPTEHAVYNFISNKNISYLKYSNSDVVDMSAAEINQVNTDMATALLNRQRLEAKEAIDSSDHNAKLLRAIIIVLLDENNSLRSWIRAFKTETAAATNLANFQARVAGLPNVPDRTLTQARNAVKSKIAAGDVDN